MLTVARKAVESALRPSCYASVTVPVQALPDRYTLQQLYSDLVASSGDSAGSDTGAIVILDHCLQYPERIVREPADSEYIQKLLLWLARSIKPTGDLVMQDGVPDDERTAEREVALERMRFMSSVALSTMRYLLALLAPLEKDVDPSVLLSMIAYTNKEDPWTSEPAQKVAELLLNSLQKELFNNNSIIDYILMGFIRPLFSSSKPVVVTSQGRKAINPTSSGHNPSDLDPSSKPWKSREVSAITVFGWTIKHADEATIYKSWHLCIPPLLTLLDDISVPVRARGLYILSDMLSKTPAKVLQQTGLGEVFEDAVMPTLLFLPSLTPVEESIRVLKPAYSALFKLGDVRFLAKEDLVSKMKFLDRMMRHGVLQGLLHSRDHVKIVELLLGEMNILTCSMGLNALKHLKDLVPILSSVLSDPFGPTHPGLLLAALKATQSVILNCWPRMSQFVHRVELVKALALCWTVIREDSSANDEPRDSQLDAVKQELAVTGLMLVKSVEGGKIDMIKELEPLLRFDPTIGALFGMDITAGNIAAI